MKKVMFGFFVLLGSAAGVYAQDTTSTRSTNDARSSDMYQDKQDKDKYDEKEAIAVSELPQKVQASVQSKDYSGWNVSKAYRKEKEGKTFYAVELMKGSEKKIVKFDAQGNKIKEKEKGM